MAPYGPAADVVSFAIAETTALLSCAAFLVLWRRSRAAAFGLLAAAFALLFGGIFFFAWWSASHAGLPPLSPAFELGLLAAAVATLAIWGGRQANRIRELGANMDRLRREAAESLDMDRLTGLLNQAALARRLEEPLPFEGVVAVCDMDSFKEINDSYGHLAGDEILRNVGRLLQASVRTEDEAFRWGGDEFVILFHNQISEVASRRMADIEARLRSFQLRGAGALPISFSWGTAEARGRPLRDALNEADRSMYLGKRKRAASLQEPPTAV